MASKKGRAVDVAFDEIRRMIRHYKLQPGQTVSDFELARKLDLSRTPIREAIYLLLDYGLLERNANKIVVKPIRIDDVNEILQVREAVELKCAEIIIANGGLNPEQKESLLNIQKELEKSINEKLFDENYKLDSKFHRELVLCANNSRFLNIYDRLDIQSERLRWLTGLKPERYERISRQHSDIINNLCSQDSKATANVIKEHMQEAIAAYDEILQGNQWDKILQTLMQLVQ